MAPLSAMDQLVKSLELKPHPEGGYYRETYRAPLQVETAQGKRNVGTAIYYLLPKGAYAAFHRVTSDEVWHHYDGAPLMLHLIENGAHRQVRLGRQVGEGEQPQAVVRAGVLQAAEPLGEYALCGCTVAPGFDFADWSMPPFDEMAVDYPKHREVLKRLARR